MTRTARQDAAYAALTTAISEAVAADAEAEVHDVGILGDYVVVVHDAQFGMEIEHAYWTLTKQSDMSPHQQRGLLGEALRSLDDE